MRKFILPAFILDSPAQISDYHGYVQVNFKLNCDN